MAILRNDTNKNFTIINNFILQNGFLSLKAIGMYSKLVSLPNNWKFTETGLVSICGKDKRDSVRSALLELENANLLFRFRIRNEKGEIKDNVYYISSSPMSDEQKKEILGMYNMLESFKMVDITESQPMLENPMLDNPILGNPTLLNNNILNKKELNNNIYSPAKKEKEIRHKYGEYKNVLLTDEQLDKLKVEFPSDYEKRIQNVDDYVQSTGKTYKDYLATIRNWAKKETKKQTNKQDKQVENDIWNSLKTERVIRSEN